MPQHKPFFLGSFIQPLNDSENQPSEEFPSPDSSSALTSTEVPASVRGTCNTLKEIAVFPQETYSSGQGFNGVRVWYFSGDETTFRTKLQEICESHWPGHDDWVPVSVQYGAVDQNTAITNVITNINTQLPIYGCERKIVAQYQLLHISDPWPTIGKPAHPAGSILALQVRGSGEILQIEPISMRAGLSSNATSCTGWELASGETFNGRIKIPLTDYNLICDRLTDKQLCQIMSPIQSSLDVWLPSYAPRHWKYREGTVNSDCAANNDLPLFLGEPEGTVLFDAWTLDQTFAPDTVDPRRWRLTCSLKCRQIVGAKAPYPEDCTALSYAAGWNHDYKRGTDGRFGWQFIGMQDYSRVEAENWTPHGQMPVGWVPRYQYRAFTDLFCAAGVHDCETGDNQTCCDILEPDELASAASCEDTPASSSSTLPTIQQIVQDARNAGERRERREYDLRKQGIDIRPWREGGSP